MPWNRKQKQEWWKNLSPEERRKKREKMRRDYHNQTPEERERRKSKRIEYINKNREELNRKIRERKSKHKQYLIEMLGGECVGCGVTTNLQFDHIDRREKKQTITTMLAGKLEKAITEAKKCQLLCEECHQLKTTVYHDCNQLMTGYKVSQVTQDGDEYVVRLTRYKS